MLSRYSSVDSSKCVWAATLRGSTDPLEIRAERVDPRVQGALFPFSCKARVDRVAGKGEQGVIAGDIADERVLIAQRGAEERGVVGVDDAADARRSERDD